MARKRCSKLCGALGFKILNLNPDGEKLEQRLKIPTEEIKVDKNKSESKSRKNAKKKRKDLAKMKHKIIEKYLMGQNVIESNIPDLVDTLLKRDAPKIYYWDGKKLLGPILYPLGLCLNTQKSLITTI